MIDHGGSVEYFRDAVFNYPTLAEAYKVAALDGLNRIASIPLSTLQRQSRVTRGMRAWSRWPPGSE